MNPAGQDYDIRREFWLFIETLGRRLQRRARKALKGLGVTSIFRRLDE